MILPNLDTPNTSPQRPQKPINHHRPKQTYIMTFKSFNFKSKTRSGHPTFFTVRSIQIHLNTRTAPQTAWTQGKHERQELCDAAHGHEKCFELMFLDLTGNEPNELKKMQQTLKVRRLLWWEGMHFTLLSAPLGELFPKVPSRIRWTHRALSYTNCSTVSIRYNYFTALAFSAKLSHQSSLLPNPVLQVIRVHEGQIQGPTFWAWLPGPWCPNPAATKTQVTQVLNGTF